MHAIRATRRGGGHVGYVRVAQDVALPGLELFFSHLHLHGGPAPVRDYLAELIDLILTGKINPGKVFDLELPPEEAAEGYKPWTSAAPSRCSCPRRYGGISCRTCGPAGVLTMGLDCSCASQFRGLYRRDDRLCFRRRRKTDSCNRTEVVVPRLPVSAFPLTVSFLLVPLLVLNPVQVLLGLPSPTGCEHGRTRQDCVRHAFSGAVAGRMLCSLSSSGTINSSSGTKTRGSTPSAANQKPDLSFMTASMTPRRGPHRDVFTSTYSPGASFQLLPFLSFGLSSGIICFPLKSIADFCQLIPRPTYARGLGTAADS